MLIEREDKAMAFLDGVKGKISKASYSTVQRAKDMSELTKLNIAITESETKITELYSEIGYLIYEAYRENPITEVEKQMTQISELKEAIEVCNIQIKALNAGNSCPRCGAKIKSAMIYCSNCGLKLKTSDENVNPESDNTLICSKCGEPLEPGNVFCTKCGNKIENY